MKELLKNKLFIIISLFIILITFISSSCFASYNFTVTGVDENFYTFTINDELFSKPYIYIYYLTKNTNSEHWNYFVYIYSDIELIQNYDYFNTDYEHTFLEPIDKSLSPIYYYKTKFMPVQSSYSNEAENFYNLTTSDLSIKERGAYYYNDSKTTFIDYTYKNDISTSLIYSNNDIKDINNNVVFQAPPQQVEAVTIPAIQQVEEIPQGMNQVLQVIIPIGLIVLSIGLVVYLTRLVIYRMK